MPATLTVVNEAGAGDAHYLGVAGPALLTDHITGASRRHHAALTPVASRFSDYIVLAINADPTIRTVEDRAERLRRDRKSRQSWSRITRP